MKKLLALTFALALVFSSANAVTVGLHTSNMGIGTMTWSVSGSDIYIWEDWTMAGGGFLVFNELSSGANYTVHKYIANNTGTDWDRFALEILDPAGNANDDNDIPNEAWVPAGFTHSNDNDGVSFAQGSGIPRTSEHFTTRTDNEFGGRDYMDFFDGLISGAGGTDTLSFGLRDNQNNQPFLLAQRPNAVTGGPEIPEPTTMILFGLGLAGVAIRNRFKK